jgi:hypothetical protein
MIPVNTLHDRRSRIRCRFALRDRISLMVLALVCIIVLISI